MPVWLFHTPRVCGGYVNLNLHHGRETLLSLLFHSCLNMCCIKTKDLYNKCIICMFQMGLCYTFIAAKEQAVVTSLEVLFRVETTWRLRGVCNIPKTLWAKHTTQWRHWFCTGVQCGTRFRFWRLKFHLLLQRCTCAQDHSKYNFCVSVPHNTENMSFKTLFFFFFISKHHSCFHSL